MTEVLAALAGLLIGSIPTADLVARARGLDLRAAGTGNPGTANAIAVGGAATGAIVLVADLIKGAGAVIVGRVLGGDVAGLIAGAAAIAGQVVNPWYRGRGGKGLGVAGGATAAAWPLGLAVVLPILGVAAWRLRSARGALVGLAAYAIAGAVWGLASLPTAWGVRADGTLTAFALAVAAGLSIKFAASLRSGPGASPAGS